MFVQVIFGRTQDASGLERRLEVWRDDLASGADGWLGSAGGVTADGRFALAVRFESETAARRNSERPEQGEWWADTEKHLDGPAEFLDTSDVTVAHEADVTGAGFVQLMRARVRDRERFEQIEAEISPAFVALRPDVVAAYRAWFSGSEVVALDYFRSEAEARAGEAKEMPDDLRAGFGDWMAQLSGTQWYDLTVPWLQAP